MNTVSSITAAIISSRNILMTGRSNEHVLPCLENVLATASLVNVSSSKRILVHCVKEAVDQIRGSEYISAGRILNLIHNLPLTEESEKRWDIDYFLSIELVAFLDDFDNVKNAGYIALYVCGQIANRYIALDG